MQEAMNLISDWAKKWLAMINRTMTEATCFSLSPKREWLILQINGQELHQQDTPTYLGMKLHRKLTWCAHISIVHCKTLRKMALVKKLEGTKWAVNMKMLTQVYTATVRPHMEYAPNAWSSAARTSLDQLTQTQNTGMSIITGGMKITPISEVERTAGLLSLEERREGKLLRQSEKMKRLPSHPLHFKFEAPTNNRLKRQSPNHLVKALQQKHRISSSARNQPLEMFQNYEDWQAETPTIILDIPGIQAKEDHTDEVLRSLILEALSVAYTSITWTRAYTDESAEEAAKNGEGGVFIKLPDGTSIRKSVVTGQQSTNYRAETYALLAAAQTLNQEDRLPTNRVFLTDCWSILQSLQSPGGEQIFSNIRQLSLLKKKTSVTLQWIPSHCGVWGNEEADRLSKMGNKFEQSAHPMSHSKAKPS